jgi:serine/threonine-protein kinase
VSSDNKQQNFEKLASSQEGEQAHLGKEVSNKSHGHTRCRVCHELITNEDHNCRKKGAVDNGQDPYIGKTVGRHYQIIACLGQGGMSTVYKARDVTIGRTVAVKFLSHGTKSREETLIRFQREAHLIGRLDHPNIIGIHAFDFTADKQPFLVIDYLNGETLAQKISRSGALPIKTSIEIFIQVCDGLAHAHSNGILHRDLKPSNIMLATTGPGSTTVKILDFGIAKFVEASEGTTQQLTQTGEVFGSPLYMSPEQGLGKPLTVSSDLYSMGCLMFETLTGIPPFYGKTAVETILKHQTEVPSPLREATMGAEFPEQLEKIVATLLEKEPSKRYRSAVELSNALRDLQADLMSPKPVARTQMSAGGGKLPRRWLIIGSVLTGLALLVLAASLLYFTKKVVGRAHTVDENRLVPTEQIIQQLPKLTQEERDDTKVSFDAKYTPNAICLDYRDYKFSPKGFAWISEMRNVHQLILTNTPTTDAMLDSLSKMSVLKELYLDGTEITDTGVKKLVHLPLNVLDLSHTNISDQSLAYLKQMPQLTTLKLDATRIDDRGLREVSEMKQLYHLSLCGTRITDTGIANLTQLAKLCDLNLAETNVSDLSMSTLARCKNLVILDLQRTKVKDAGLASLTGLKLQHLKLIRTGITTKGVATLARMQSLTFLSLAFTQIDDKAVPNLLKMNQLSHLNLEGCYLLTRAGLEKLKEGLPRCEISTRPEIEQVLGVRDPMDEIIGH